MNCNQVHELCSLVYDAELEGELGREAEAHLRQCEACSAEYASFVRATDALRAFEPRGASGEYVQSILAAVESPARLRVLRGPRRVASHLAALLTGAAAVALVWFGVGFNGRADERLTHAELASLAQPAPPKIDPTPPEPAIIEVPVERIVEVPVEVEKVVVKIQRDPALLSATNRLVHAFVVVQRAFEARPHAPEPRVVIERIPDASYTRAVDRLVFSLELLRRTLEREQELAGLRAARVAQRPVSDDGPIAATRPLNAPAATSQPATPVRIRRELDRLVLQRHGPLEEVVPALIAYLDDPDSEVRELVWRELDSIRGELTPGRRPASPQTATTTDPLASLAGLLRSRPPSPQSFDRPGREQWLDWWSSYGLTALGSEVL